MAYDGHSEPLSMVEDDNPFDSISFTINKTGLKDNINDATVDGRALAFLNKWARARIPVQLRNVTGSRNTSGTVIAASNDVPSYYRYVGLLTPPNHMGTSQRWGEPYRWSMSVEEVQLTADERGWYKIRLADAGAQAFTVDGDWTALFIPGQGFRVWGSTNNDKQFATLSSAYDDVNNQTIIECTGGVGIVSDGYIEVYDW